MPLCLTGSHGNFPQIVHDLDHDQRFSRDKVVVDHATDGKHGESSILQLLQFQLVDLLLGLPRQSVNSKTKISGDTVRVLEHSLHGDRTLVRANLLEPSRKDYLEHSTRANSSRREVGVIYMHVLEHRERDKFTRQETDGGEHGNAAVLDLGLAEPFDVEHLGEAKRIETHITDVSVESLGLRQEGKRGGHGVGADSAVARVSNLHHTVEGGGNLYRVETS